MGTANILTEIIIVPFGEWEKTPRLEEKTLVGLRYGALSPIKPYRI